MVNIVIVLFLQNAFSEDPLEILGTNLWIKKQYDKYWMTYMYKFIERSGLVHLSSSTSIFIHSLKLLKTKSHISNIIKFYDIKMSRKQSAMYNCTYVLYRFQAFGAIIYDSDGDVYDGLFVLHRIWHFSPKKDFRIRIVFHNLKIHYSYRSCRANITVCTLNLTKHTYQGLCTGDRLLLCGDYSLFYFYPQHFKVNFNLYYITVPYFKLDVTFDLMSNNIINTIYFESKVENRYQTLYNIQVIQILLQIFYIEVSKFQKINIKFNESIKCIVYDGPGYLSEAYIIGSKSSHFLTSSFQCSIRVIFSDLKRKQQNYLCNFTRLTKYTETLVFDSKQHKSYTYNSFKKLSILHMKLMLESPKGTHFNIKIISFNFVSQNEDFNCKYGGVSMFDHTLGHMEETRSDCTTRLDDQFNLQPFHSKDHKIIIVLYSYHHYSDLSISIDVLVSDCHVVKINLCDMNQVCKASAKLCSAYLEHETISLKGKRLSKGNVYKVTFQPKGENCVIVHVEANPFSDTIPFPYLHRKLRLICALQFRVEVQKDVYIYEYDVSGYLSNYDPVWSQFQKFYAFGTPYRYDPMQNVSVIHWTNGTKEILKNLKEKDRDVFILIKPRNRSNVAFKANILEKTPHNKDSVWFYIWLAKWISWVNLHFVKTNIFPENENKILFSSFNQFKNKILGDHILKIALNKEDIEENQTELQLIIRTQVKIFFLKLILKYMFVTR